MRLFSKFVILAAATFTAPAFAALDNYGVVVGTPTAHYLEPAATEGNWPHYVVEINTPEGPYRAVINVFSRVDQQVLHREVAMAPLSSYNGVFSLSPGLHYLPFHTNANASTGGALDFARHPDLVRDIRNTPWNTTGPVVGMTSAPVFDNLFAGAQKVYVFGEPYFNSDGTKGIHDVHQNQGNTAGSSFAHLNGRWQDGAMILEYAPTRVYIPRICGFVPPCWGGFYFYLANRTLVQTRFVVQRDFTDNAGNGVNPLVNNFNAQSTVANGWVNYGPFNAGQLQIDLTSLSGNPDVYIQTGAWPTESSYRTSAVNASGNEFLRDFVGANTYVSVRATGVASSWNLKVSYLNP